MESTTAEAKEALRRQARQKLAALTAEERTRSDDALFARFLSLPQVEKAGTIFAFWGVPGREPDTARLIAALTARGKRIGLPRMLPGRRMEVRQYLPERPMVSAAFGIQEPDTACPLLEKPEIDLVLTPAVCCDRRGFRLGFGGGYYDRWLDGFDGIRVGLCREAVLLDRMPTEPHDSRVDLLLTEREVLRLP